MKTLSVFSVAHAFALMMPICFFLLYRGGRKKLKRYWRLSKEGPFFKLGVWVVGKMGEAAAAIDRALLGSKLVGDPTKCRPKFTVIKTQSDRMILSWTAPRSSAPPAAREWHPAQPVARTRLPRIVRRRRGSWRTQGSPKSLPPTPLRAGRSLRIEGQDARCTATSHQWLWRPRHQ